MGARFLFLSVLTVFVKISGATPLTILAGDCADAPCQGTVKLCIGHGCLIPNVKEKPLASSASTLGRAFLGPPPSQHALWQHTPVRGFTFVWVSIGVALGIVLVVRAQLCLQRRRNGTPNVQHHDGELELMDTTATPGPSALLPERTREVGSTLLEATCPTSSEPTEKSVAVTDVTRSMSGSVATAGERNSIVAMALVDQAVRKSFALLALEERKVQAPVTPDTQRKQVDTQLGAESRLFSAAASLLVMRAVRKAFQTDLGADARRRSSGVHSAAASALVNSAVLKSLLPDSDADRRRGS